MPDPSWTWRLATHAYDLDEQGHDPSTWKDAVRVATTVNGTLASAYENGDTIDGVTLATGDRFLVKDQTSGAENGIYTVNPSGAPTRTTDFDTAADVLGTLVLVIAGTVNAGKVFRVTNTTTPTIGSTVLTFTELTAAGAGGSDLVQVASGAGSVIIPGLSGSPDIRVAGTNDDEFDNASLTGWTQFGSPTVCNANTAAKSHLYIKKAATARQISGIYKANPSMPFTMTTKLSDGAAHADFMRAGILFVAEAGLTGKIACHAVTHDSSNFPNTPSYVPSGDIYTNSSTYGSNMYLGFDGVSGSHWVPVIPPVYLRIIATSSSSVAFYISMGGLVWQSLKTGVNPGFTIGAVGLGTNPEQTTYDAESYFDWIRFT